MIIIEGPDAAGKSTLTKTMKDEVEKIHGLSKLLDVSTNKTDSYPKRWEAGLLDIKNAISDRSFFISELVYSQLLRGHNIPETFWLPLLKEVYKKHMVIVCVGQGEHIKKEHETQEDFEKVTQEIINARAYYCYIASRMGWTTYNFQYDSETEIIDSCINYLKGES